MSLQKGMVFSLCIAFVILQLRGIKYGIWWQVIFLWKIMARCEEFVEHCLMHNDEVSIDIWAFIWQSMECTYSLLSHLLWWLLDLDTASITCTYFFNGFFHWYAWIKLTNDVVGTWKVIWCKYFLWKLLLFGTDEKNAMPFCLYVHANKLWFSKLHVSLIFLYN